MDSLCAAPQALDADGTGTVSESEFCLYLSSMKPEQPKWDLKLAAFKKYLFTLGNGLLIICGTAG